ncbi:MAG TPA: glycosyltransferase family 39 protein [Candidatus Deferrimicrobiaceae bacterium]|nr:glycosyltransferase family 39 protein [Candidatus Deferrimicrobiaceae bacterium]
MSRHDKLLPGDDLPLQRLTGSNRQWFEEHFYQTAVAAVLVGFCARIWAASGTFLNPDEALHFRLANQPSWLLAYRQSLTASHPPLLTFILYFWRALGTSELWLRMPSILAGVAFCWMFYKWLGNAAGDLAGLIGLIFVSFLPPVILLSTEIRQYALLLAFLAAALYFLDDSFAKNSSGRMVVFSLCLYLAMLSHYSAFWFAAALGIYAVLRFVTERFPPNLKATWAIGQIGALALAVFLYKSHISKLGVGESRTALQGWMSDFFLRRSYFNPAHDNPLLFLVAHSFGVFQYFFGQLAIGDVMGLLFVLGVVLLLRGKDLREQRADSHRLGVFLLLPFAVAAVAALAHVYPYGGTRHIAFLIIPAVAGVSVALARLAEQRWERAIAAAVLIVLACIAFGKTRPPSMDRADQSRKHMAAALDFIKKNVKPNDLIFTDYQTDLILGHYLCQQRPISFDAAPVTFEQFSCGGYRVVSQDYKGWQFWASNFSQEWERLVTNYKLKPGETVWIVQAGWGVGLPQDLQRHFAEFRDLHFESFGKNILIFKLTVGQPMPSVAEQADFIFPAADSTPAPGG